MKIKEKFFENQKIFIELKEYKYFRLIKKFNKKSFLFSVFIKDLKIFKNLKEMKKKEKNENVVNKSNGILNELLNQDLTNETFAKVTKKESNLYNEKNLLQDLEILQQNKIFSFYTKKQDEKKKKGSVNVLSNRRNYLRKEMLNIAQQYLKTSENKYLALFLQSYQTFYKVNDFSLESICNEKLSDGNKETFANILKIIKDLEK